MEHLEKPILILGMHRSGTTFLSKKLSEMGVFQGSRKESNNESIFFLKLNNWLLRQCNSSWGAPENFLEAIKEDRLRELLLSHIGYRINSIDNINYYGYKRKFFGLREAKWGWKDPRTTFTLPLWRQIYPDAKVLAIRRNGIDVASSLHKRANIWIDQHKNMNKAQQLKLKLFGYGDSYRSLRLESALDLWVTYEKQVDQINSQMDENFMQINYEDIPTNKNNILSELLKFVDIKPSKENVKKIQNGYDIRRILAYRENKELLELAEQYKEVLQKYGYST